MTADPGMGSCPTTCLRVDAAGGTFLGAVGVTAPTPWPYPSGVWTYHDLTPHGRALVAGLPNARGKRSLRRVAATGEPHGRARLSQADFDP